MDAPFDGTEVTVVSEDIEGSYVPSKPPIKKKRYKGSAEHGDIAKKPRSAYLLYYYDIYLKVQQEVPHLPQSEINKKISESWKLLSVAEKSYYLERAKLEKEGLDSNVKSSTPTMVSDVPGFRKILPRSDYILIPKKSPSKDKVVRQQMEICVAQPRETGIMTPSTDVSHNLEQTILSLDTGQVSLSEQCIDIEGLTEEATSYSSGDGAQKQLLSGVFSNYTGSVGDKLSGDIILDDATLEIGDSSPYQATSMVIEENGGISLAQSEIPAGLSVLTVMAIQDTEDHSVPNPTSHYFMFPMASRPTAETTRPVKLASTYTRRGRGNCTNPSCSFTYVTRHKPPKCPLCNNFLGGKWVPKTKPAKEKCPSTSNIVTPLSEHPVLEDPFSNIASGSKSTEENNEAVTQLLHASSPACGGEWEEVIISDLHIFSHNLDGTPVRVTCSKDKSINLEVETTEKVETDDPHNKTQSSAEHENMECQISSAEGEMLSSATAQKTQEAKCATKQRTTSLAAARPIRAILPAPANTNRSLNAKCVGNGLTILKSETHSSINASGLKPSTLKQLGHSVLPQPLTQEIMIRSDPQGPASQPQLKVLTKYSSPVTLDLGLATQRGRGKCKNPLCNFMYTNRHKPKVCPKCGSNLSKDKAEKGPRIPSSPPETQVCVQKVMSDSEPLTQSQKETQRQSTLQLLRKTVQIPENECELSEVFVLIQELNSSRLVLSNVSDGTVTIEQTSWASFYEPSATHCLLCAAALFTEENNSQAGPQKCWLLTASRLQVVTTQVKICKNTECLAIHSFNDIYTGLFNVGNKLLVSLDLLFSIRNQIKLGDDPKVSISNIVESVQEQAEKRLNPEETISIHELLNCGYWAFECLTVRDYNDMICGVCGVAPKVEIAQRNAENTLTLTNVEFTWPEFLTSNEVSVEDFWSTLETEVLEQATFSSNIPITKFDASILSPFFPPLMRAPVVVNSESYKNLEVQKVPGNASALVKLFQEGSLKLDELNLKTEEELQKILSLCRIPWIVTDTKDQMCYSILALSEFVQNGTQTKQPPPHLTGGKLYKVCPHQVICGSKYIVRGESPRDHVDLLASSRHWPPVYVVDMATQVSLCADLCYSNLTQEMWGKNQGCFSDPSKPPKYVSCPELLDRHFNVDIMGNEPSILHPVTKSASRRVVHAGAEQNGACDPTSRHHSITLCRELEPYSAIITAIGDSKTSNIRHLPINFENPTHYYLYNRLIDFLTSREIVNRQINDIVQSCQPGEVVIRDTLYRLGVAQINTELLESELEEENVQEQPI
ncbi:HMG domain-containing protein 3 [Pelobates fuscus]|uniref:HMG domain-containing protein 3 n=1 Tax=Pelobates fuscus TaxID=191477 RepID=UPI002FE4B2FA